MTPGYRDDAPLRPGDRVGVFTVDVCTFADERSIAYRAEGPAGPVELRLYSLSNADQMAGRRFEREGLFLSRTLTVLAHPTVRRIHAAGYHANDVWTASAPPAGAALPRWCAEAPRPWHVIASMFHEVAAALAAVELTGILPHILTADDIRVGPDLHACVDLGNGFADYFIRRSQVPDSDSVSADPIPLPYPGTAWWSPEDLMGSSRSFRANHFVLCAIAWEALYGRAPFAGAHFIERVTNLLEGRIDDPPPGAGVPASLRRVLTRGLAVDPNARFPSTVVLAEAFKPGLLARLFC